MVEEEERKADSEEGERDLIYLACRIELNEEPQKIHPVRVFHPCQYQTSSCKMKENTKTFPIKS